MDVVEISQDVIDLVWKHVADDRCHLHVADCRTKEWPKGSKWDFVWHDVWNDICGDNLADMKTLRKRFARKCSWQGCWAEMETRVADARAW